MATVLHELIEDQPVFEDVDPKSCRLYCLRDLGKKAFIQMTRGDAAKTYSGMSERSESDREAFEVKLAVAEATMNAVRHNEDANPEEIEAEVVVPIENELHVLIASPFLPETSEEANIHQLDSVEDVFGTEDLLASGFRKMSDEEFAKIPDHGRGEDLIDDSVANKGFHRTIKKNGRWIVHLCFRA